jgi:filamentous hemagglutinin family protein
MIPKITSWLVWARPVFIVGQALALLTTGETTGPAQVVLDGKFGTGGALSGPNYTITAGMGAIRGNNLFQSFSQFNLVAGDVATFTGPANIKNILSRVTGGSPSSIDGTIRSGIAGANFFFINPSGVVFGPNAILDVSGSFAASTANYLKLADGAKFVAALDADDSGLSSAPVSAFGFLGNSSASVNVQQTSTSVPLAVADGNTLSLVGGDININGSGLDIASVPLPSLKAAGGRINLVSVNSAGEVPVDPLALTPAQFNTAFPVQGQITLQNGALVDASGDGGGRIVIRGGNLLIDSSSIQANTTGNTDGKGIDIAVPGNLTLSNGGQIDSFSTLGLGAGGDININASSITLDGGGLVDDNYYPLTQISTSTGDLFAGGGAGRGGNITIQTGSLGLINSAQISSASFDAGDAGRIDITASTITLDALLSTVVQITANTQQTIGGGNAGDIIIHTGSLNINNAAQLLATTSGSGDAGSISITANLISLTDYSLISTATYGTGGGGNINITAASAMVDASFIQAESTFSDPDPGLCKGGSISINASSIDVNNGGLISATTLGSGAGGSVNLTANSVILTGDNGASGLPTGISAASGQDFGGGDILVGTGNGGDIVITSKNPGELSLTMSDGAQISTATLGSGNGGNVVMTMGNLVMGNSSTVTAAAADGATGTAGTISLLAKQNISLAGNSSISTSAPGGSGGNIAIEAGSEIQLADSKITTQAGLDGGNINVAAGDLVNLLHSTITGAADFTGSGFGNGGNLTIDPSFLILNDSSLISKSSLGNGGNIDIQSDYFFQSSSTIDATAPFGLPGTVTVTAPNVDLSASLVDLPSGLLDVETLLQPDCGVRLSGNISSFIVLGSGGLPVAPGGFVPSSVPARANDKK